VEVAVGADAGVFVGDPGAAEGFLCFEHDKAGAGALGGEVIGPADSRDAGTDNKNIEMVGNGLGGVASQGEDVVHAGRPCGWERARIGD
jgi:hypothetical protein